MMINLEQPCRGFVIESFLCNPPGNQLSVFEAMDLDRRDGNSVFLLRLRRRSDY